MLEINREWSPIGVDRFYHLVSIGYYQDIAFFRAIKGFMVQFGIHSNPKVNAAWKGNPILDEPVKASNTTGTVSFAKGGPNTRTTQLFINTKDNKNLDAMGFVPLGTVLDMEPNISGLDLVKSLYTGYGEGGPRGKGPNQMYLQQQGKAYLKQFPKLDYILSTRICKKETPQNPCP